MTCWQLLYSRISCSTVSGSVFSKYEAIADQLLRKDKEALLQLQSVGVSDNGPTMDHFASAKIADHYLAELEDSDKRKIIRSKVNL